MQGLILIIAHYKRHQNTRQTSSESRIYKTKTMPFPGNRHTRLQRHPLNKIRCPVKRIEMVYENSAFQIKYSYLWLRSFYTQSVSNTYMMYYQKPCLRFERL